MTFSTTTNLCPLPNINSIHPSRGPREGGTHVTITGTNLGAAYSDILEVRLHSEAGTSVECTLAGEETYVIGRQIVCVTQNSSSTGEQMMLIQIQRESNEEVASALYTLEQSQLSGINPAFGPQSGGIEVVISGNNLDIGNTENTRVSLSQVNCNILE